MKMKIKNRKELREHILVLENELVFKEVKVRKRLEQVKESLTPEHIILNTISKLTGINLNKKEFFREGLMTGLGLVLQRVFFKSESTLENKVYDLVGSLFKKIDDLVRRFANRSEAGVNRIEKEEE